VLASFAYDTDRSRCLIGDQRGWQVALRRLHIADLFVGSRQAALIPAVVRPRGGELCQEMVSLFGVGDVLADRL
jgi:hypothetical protein